MSLWYKWDSEEEFEKKCQDPDWRRRMRALLYFGGCLDEKEIQDVKASPEHLEKIGIPAYVVDEFVYKLAARQFVKDNDIPRHSILLRPHEAALLQWGISQGLPLDTWNGGNI